MSYRNVLVHVKSSEAWSQHIEVAAWISHIFGARLTGLFTVTDIAKLRAALGAESPVAWNRRTGNVVPSEGAESLYREFLKQTGIHGDWKIGVGAASELLIWASRFHELVVVEQTDDAAHEYGFDVAERCALESGCPTLVVPCRGQFPTVGRRILVAWNGSRGAALAVRGALPFIAKAERVDVLLGTRKETFSYVTGYPDLKIADYLRHQTSAVEDRHFDPADADAGAAILDEARTAGADLIVMGAYGRSKLSEWILGGATRYVLREMPIPVLMAH